MIRLHWLTLYFLIPLSIDHQYLGLVSRWAQLWVQFLATEESKHLLMLNSWPWSSSETFSNQMSSWEQIIYIWKQILCKYFFFPHLFRGTQNYPQVRKSTFYCLCSAVVMANLSDQGMSYSSGGDHLKGKSQRGSIVFGELFRMFKSSWNY